MTPEVLAPYLVSAMLAWIPAAQHDPGPTVEAAKRQAVLAAVRPRYERIATAIATVTLAEGAKLPFEGENRHVLTALLLASIAGYEGSYTEAVATCQRGGDMDAAGVPQAWGLWQTHRPKEAVCASLEAGAGIALGMVSHSFTVCRRLEVSDRLGVYTDNACRRKWWRSRSRVDRAIAWQAAHPLAA